MFLELAVLVLIVVLFVVVFYHRRLANSHYKLIDFVERLDADLTATQREIRQLKIAVTQKR